MFKNEQEKISLRNPRSSSFIDKASKNPKEIKEEKPNNVPAEIRKFEKSKTNNQLNSKNKLRENLIPKISVRTSKPSLG